MRLSRTWANERGAGSAAKTEEAASRSTAMKDFTSGPQGLKPRQIDTCHRAFKHYSTQTQILLKIPATRASPPLPPQLRPANCPARVDIFIPILARSGGFGSRAVS